jgi:hypothetical protein
MATQTRTQKAHALLRLYKEEYKKKFGYEPNVNSNRDKWGFMDMVDDVGYERSRLLIETFFTLYYENYELPKLFRNYDKVLEEQREWEEDQSERRRLRELTRQRVEEFEKRNDSND